MAASYIRLQSWNQREINKSHSISWYRTWNIENDRPCCDYLWFKIKCAQNCTTGHDDEGQESPNLVSGAFIPKFGSEQGKNSGGKRTS